MPSKVEISHKTVIFTVLFLVGLYFLYTLREILLEIYLALIIMAILNPLVAKLSRLRIPRGLSVLVVYIIVFGLFGLVIAGLIPPLVEQTTNFANRLPEYLTSFSLSTAFGEQIVREALSFVGGLPGQVAKVTVRAFSNVLNVVSVLIFAFYFLLARQGLKGLLSSFFGNKRGRELAKIVDEFEERIGGWSRGQLLLMLLVGSLTYIGLLILGIPFALPLAILAGLLEVVPYLGPILAAIPAAIIGFGISPLMGFVTVALSFLVQQLENYVFVPKIMEKSVGVNPIITLLALAIGLKLAGVVGVIISVPTVITAQIVGREYFKGK